MDETLQSRFVGIIVLLLGIIMCYADYKMRNFGDSYYPQLTVISPCIVGMAFNLIVEAPPIPVLKPSIFAWCCASIGMAFGVWNLFF